MRERERKKENNREIEIEREIQENGKDGGVEEGKICALENEFDDLIEAFMGPYKWAKKDGWLLIKKGGKINQRVFATFFSRSNCTCSQFYQHLRFGADILLSKILQS